MSGSIWASVKPGPCSSFREAEVLRAAAEWARSLAASTALLRIEASCTADAQPVSMPTFRRRAN